MGSEILAQDPPEILFSRARRRPVIIGQVEMGDTRIEGHVQDLTAIL